MKPIKREDSPILIAQTAGNDGADDPALKEWNNQAIETCGEVRK